MKTVCATVGIALLLMRPAMAQETPGQRRAREVEEVRQRNAARLKDEAARVIEMKRAAANPKIARVVLSRWLCVAQGDLEEAQSELAEDKRVETESGVADLRARHEAGETIVAAKDNVRTYQARLKALGLKPLPCDSMGAAYECDGSDPKCNDRVRTLKEIGYYGEGVLLGVEDPPSPATAAAPPAAQR